MPAGVRLPMVGNVVVRTAFARRYGAQKATSGLVVVDHGEGMVDVEWSNPSGSEIECELCWLDELTVIQ